MITSSLGVIDGMLMQRLSAAPRIFCCIDYDGTLAPLARTPDVALPLPGSTLLLRELAAAPGTDVAVVTGRTIDNVRRFVDVPLIYYIGVHGVEMRLPGGDVHTAPAAATLRAVVRQILPRLVRAMGDRPGILIEDKDAALACHYRLASPSDAAKAREVMAVLAHEFRHHGVALTHGHKVAEIRSARVSKGTSVRALIAAHAPDALPIYIGDDQTDEEAFRALPAPAVTIRVAPTHAVSHARYQLANPEEVQDFLRALLRVRAPWAVAARPLHEATPANG